MGRNYPGMILSPFGGLSHTPILYYFYIYNFNNIIYLCQSTIKSHLDVTICAKEFLSKYDADRLISEAHSEEKTHVME